MKHLHTSRSFKKEFKKQVRLAIAAAVGFSIAFAWRQSIFDTFLSFVARFLNVPKGHYLSEVYTALAITLAGVILLSLTSKILKD